MSDFLDEVRKFAYEAHKFQKYGDKPYTYHLDHVVSVLTRFGFKDDQNLIAAGYLHDSIEDVEDVTKEIIEEKFGSEIAEIVYAVTDESGKNRKERKEKTYPKIKANTDAIFVKLADRIANVESSKGKSLMKMYLKEHKEFKSQLMRDEDSITLRELHMWNYLEGLMG